MNIKQSASIMAILVAVVFTGAGCLRSSPGNETKPIVTAKPSLNVPAELRGQDSPTVEPQETTTTDATGMDGSMTTTVFGDTTTVRDDRTKVAFSVPTSLGEVETQDENGWGYETTEKGNADEADCLVQRSFRAGDTIFLTIYDTWQCDQYGRGGYWGDQAKSFSTEQDVKKWCESKDVCTPYVNPNGITIYHAYSKSVDSWGDTLSDIDEYGAWNPNKDIHGILISNQGFVQAGLGRMRDEIKVVADSLSFLE